MLRSSDFDLTWQTQSSVAPEDMTVGLLTLDPDDPPVLYLVVGGGLRRSEDEGLTWKHIFSLDGLPVYSLNWHPAARPLYATTLTGLIVSRDHGVT